MCPETVLESAIATSIDTPQGCEQEETRIEVQVEPLGIETTYSSAKTIGDMTPPVVTVSSNDEPRDTAAQAEQGMPAIAGGSARPWR